MAKIVSKGEAIGKWIDKWVLVGTAEKIYADIVDVVPERGEPAMEALTVVFGSPSEGLGVGKSYLDVMDDEEILHRFLDGIDMDPGQVNYFNVIRGGAAVRKRMNPVWRDCTVVGEFSAVGPKGLFTGQVRA
jgi:hypothetical protein